MKHNFYRRIRAGILLLAALAITGCTAQNPTGSGTAGSSGTPSGTGAATAAPAIDEVEKKPTMLLYQGHSSMRITTPEGKIIYVDPYAGEGYDLPADLILLTHQHSDHNQLSLIASRNPGCQVITEKEALANGKLQTLSPDGLSLTVEATEAGNANHDPAEGVGFIITFSDGVQLYISGDTSKTEQMETFSQRKIDYAFFCCDGIYNMDTAEASECAALVGARHSIPYHMTPNAPFDAEIAEAFQAEGRLILTDMGALELTKAE
jgi:L-ascorbate metabolism protein UlaG (beta-lactamase superfamily)